MLAPSPDSAGTSPAVWRLPWWLAFAVVGVLLLSVWPFWDGLNVMWGYWVGAPEYSHAILIPFIAGFLIWQRRDLLERVPFAGSWLGLGLVALGGILLVMGQLATIYTLIQYAYLVTLYGLVLSFTGIRPFRLIAVPLLILVFMIPLPEFALANLSTRLQLLSSEFGVWFMRLFGISVYLEGNVIDLGGYKLQVAEACSGLRYLFPLMTLGFLMGYFYKGALWKRIVLFLSSIPLTLLMNSFRVGTIGVMVEHWGIGMAEGFLHEFQGWVMFMFCSALMLGEIVILTRIGAESGTWRQLFGVEFPAASPRGARFRPRSTPVPFIAASVTLALFVIIAVMLPRPTEVVPERASFVEFPIQQGGWTGHREPMEGIYLDALKLDDYLIANYADAGGHSVNLYLAYYNSQRKGEAVHSPRACLPGGGWQLQEFGQRTLPGVLVNGSELRVNRTLIRLGNQHQLVYYYFQQRGRIITNEFAVKWYLFWDALTRHRTDGALVRLIVNLPPGTNVAEADRLLTQFTTRIAPQVPRYVPN